MEFCTKKVMIIFSILFSHLVSVLVATVKNRSQKRLLNDWAHDVCLCILMIVNYLSCDITKLYFSFQDFLADATATGLGTTNVFILKTLFEPKQPKRNGFHRVVIVQRDSSYCSPIHGKNETYTL